MIDKPSNHWKTKSNLPPLPHPNSLKRTGKPRLVYTGPASNGGTESSYPSGQASVIVPFVTTYSTPFVSATGSSNGNSEQQLTSLQPSSIKRTYPPASSSPAPSTALPGTAAQMHENNGEKKIKLDTEEESEK